MIRISCGASGTRAFTAALIGWCLHNLFCLRLSLILLLLLQARHSYCWEDIRWDRTFASCVTRGEDGACEVDFSKFHDTLPAPANCDDHGFIQSYA